MAAEENPKEPLRFGPQKPNLSFFASQVLLAVVIIAVVALLVLLLIATYQAFLLALAGILLAIFLRGIADWVKKWLRIPQKLSVIVTAIILIGLLAFFIWFMSARLVSQFASLLDELNRSFSHLEESLSQSQLGRILTIVIPSAQEISKTAVSFVGKATGFFSTTLGIIAGLVVIFFIGFYGAYNPGIYTSGFLRLMPINVRGEALHVMRVLSYTLGWWLIARVFSMVVIGILTGIGLWALGVPLPLALAVLVGLLTFIPYIGAIVAFIPILVLALAQSLSLGLYVLILYISIHIIEGYLLTPIVEQKAVSLPPAFTLFVQAIAGVLFGFLGIVLASPLAASAMVLFRILYVNKILGDDIPETRSRESDKKIDEKDTHNSKQNPSPK